MAKTVLRLTNNYAGVKANAAGTYTFSLATDLLLPSEVVSGTPTVDIYGATFSGEAASTITVSRNSVDIFNISPSTASSIDFSQMGMKETINNTSDIVVVITGKAQIYLELRKSAGYKTKLEFEQFGSHDDPAAQGS
jgi:hypothetical protein